MINLKLQKYLLSALVMPSLFALTACQTNQTLDTNTTMSINTKVDEHSAEYALDYEGVYTGTLPCADCSGIKTQLILNKDHTFSYQQTYLDTSAKPFLETGNYQVKGNILTLPLADSSLNLFVGESAVFYVDKNLQRYTGQLASHYQLNKQ